MRKIVGLTGRFQRPTLKEATGIGFAGLLSKHDSLSEFWAGLLDASEGRAVMSRRAAAQSRGLRRKGPLKLGWDLTPREREVLALLVRGANTQMLAAELGVSQVTVRTHVQNILTKLGVHSRLAAASMAMRHDLGGLPESTDRRIA